MCEIAIINPAKYSPKEVKEIAMTLYEAMRSSLGVAAVYDRNQKFSYDTYKAVEPDRDDLLEFLNYVIDEGAERVVIHGRLKTHGAVIDDHAHPLEVDCPECDVDYVVHNGIVSRHNYTRKKHEQLGHEYNTEVDSEVIAHSFGRVPKSFDEDDMDHHDHERAFVLMNEDAILIHASQHAYDLSKFAEMSLSYRDFGPADDDDKYHRIIMTPAEEE